VPRGSEVRECAAGARRRRRFRSSLVALLLTASGAALLTGCGASGAGQAASSRAALLTTLENWSALQTPVDQALGILTQQCMAQHGYRYYPYPEAGQPGGSPFFATPLFGGSLWLGPQSLAWRLVNGWGLYEQIMQQLGQPGGLNGDQPQENQVMRSLRGRAMVAYIKALYGGGKSMKIRIPGLPHFTIQIGGCNTTAGAKLFGSVAASVAVPQYGPSILNGSVQSTANRSPALHASQAMWAACVKARTRLAVRSPSQLFLRFYSLYQTKGPTPAVHRQEIAAAVADLQCQRRSRLPQTVRKAALSAIGHLPASVVGELGTLLSTLQQARSRSQTLFAHPAASPTVTKRATGPTGSSGAANGAQPAVGQGAVRRSVVVLGG
jgi:hypothetical protein